MPYKLQIKSLSVSINKKTILKDVNLKIAGGKIYMLMGPNGSGKSTLAQAVMGNPSYTVRGKIILNGKDITRLPPHERARRGLFLAFQSPIDIPGITLLDLLETRGEALRKPVSQLQAEAELKSQLTKVALSDEFLGRHINVGFSGGERKKFELLQLLAVKPDFAILDEIDSGLDADASRMIGAIIHALTKQGTGILFITHSAKILSYADVAQVYVVSNGTLIAIRNNALAEKIELDGYKDIAKKICGSPH